MKFDLPLIANSRFLLQICFCFLSCGNTTSPRGKDHFRHVSLKRAVIFTWPRRTKKSVSEKQSVRRISSGELEEEYFFQSSVLAAAFQNLACDIHETCDGSCSDIVSSTSKSGFGETDSLYKQDHDVHGLKMFPPYFGGTRAITFPAQLRLQHLRHQNISKPTPYRSTIFFPNSNRR
jgi:hypothetical protein